MITLNKVLVFIAVILISIVLLCCFAVKQARSLHRAPNVLLNKYYVLKHTHTEAAKQALLIILQQNVNNISALKELSQLYLEAKQFDKALPLIERLHHLLPDNTEYSLLLVYLKDNENKSGALESTAFKMEQPLDKDYCKRNSLMVASNAAHLLPGYLPCASTITTEQKKQNSLKKNNTLVSTSAHSNTIMLGKRNKEQQLLTQFFVLKEKNKVAAWAMIQTIIVRYPNNIQALKEGGYLAINLGYLKDAIRYFKRVEQLTHEPEVAMQLAYLYDRTANKKAAYRQFTQIARDKNNPYYLRAENAVTNLAGLQTKIFPSPYFGEFFFSPWIQSRFGLTVRPIIARIGVESNTGMQVKKYMVFRQTDDNRSMNLGQLPQIFEDNVRIFGAGIQITPLASLPLSAYIEAGGAYDLILQSKQRWRFDLRSNLVYYNAFGAKPHYAGALKLGLDYYSTLYGSLAYFSRYNNNVIGTLVTHQGVRLLQYHNTMVNLYATGRVMSDTNRDFFNNFAEVGPGISFIPSNRFNVQLRFEYINGMYLPAGGDVNPYGKYYKNRIVYFLFYVKV